MLFLVPALNISLFRGQLKSLSRHCVSFLNASKAASARETPFTMEKGDHRFERSIRPTRTAADVGYVFTEAERGT